jgi:hypothetical protein
MTGILALTKLKTIILELQEPEWIVSYWEDSHYFFRWTILGGDPNLEDYFPTKKNGFMPREEWFKKLKTEAEINALPVSYTHLTLPTKLL